ncbi:peptidoglycan recognition protein family protein [Georgenia sp.]
MTVVGLTGVASEPTRIALDGLERLEHAEVPTDQAATELVVRTAGAGSGGPMSASRPVLLPATTAVTAAEAADVLLLTPPMETPEFFVAGVTWDEGPSQGGLHVFIRAMQDGEWLEWTEAEVESAEDVSTGTVGTDPYVAGGATAVQVQVSGPEGTLPENLQLSLMPSNPAESAEVVTEEGGEVTYLPEEDAPADVADPVAFNADANFAELGVAASTFVAVAAGPQEAVVAPVSQVTTAPTSGTTAVPTTATPATTAMPAALTGGVLSAVAPRPNIITRAGWGADSSIMTWTPKPATLKAAIVHHTAGQNAYTAAQSPGIVRGIYYYHAVTRDWGDIGYNFLVDKYGQIFEGRAGSLSAPAGTMIVGAHAGGFNTGTLGIAAMGDFTKVNAPQVILDRMAQVIAWRFADTGIDVWSPSGIIAPGTNYVPAGSNLPRIFGHRDVANITRTTCPGDDIYGRLASLSSAVDNLMGQRIYLNNRFSGYSDVNFRFGAKGAEIIVGDWNGDGRDTLAARLGNRFVVTDQNANLAATRVVYYGDPGDEIYVGDWDGNGTDTFAVRRGNQFHIRNSMTSGEADRVIYYGDPGDKILVGDWDGNGADTFAVRRANQFHIRNTLTSGYADRAFYYGDPGDVILVGDWDGARGDSFAVRRGIRYHIRNSLSSGIAEVVFDYGNATDRTVVGDWDANGTATLGVTR